MVWYCISDFSSGRIVMTVPSPKEGLKLARLLMVLSSLSPLFVFWAIRGNSLIHDLYFVPVCLGFAVFPNVFLYMRICKAKKERDRRQLKIGKVEDHRNHVLVYLFAMMLPFFQVGNNTYREIVAFTTALVFIVFLFWRLNLHYMNIYFAFRGYQVYSVSTPSDGNVHSGRETTVLITYRRYLTPGMELHAYRLSNSVYLESRE